MKYFLLLLAALWAPASALAASTVTPIPAPCTITTTAANKTDYSGNVTTSSAVLIPAAPQGVARTGVFIQCLSSSCTLAVNPSGGTASLTSAGNMVTTGQYTGFNFASLGFIPQGAVTAVADGTRVVSAYACPR